MAGVIARAAALIYSFSITALTNEDKWQKTTCIRFADCLKTVFGGRVHGLRRKAFESYLPIAACFGCAAEWFRYFWEHMWVPVPRWFRALDTGQAGFADVINAEHHYHHRQQCSLAMGQKYIQTGSPIICSTKLGLIR